MHMGDAIRHPYGEWPMPPFRLQKFLRHGRHELSPGLCIVQVSALFGRLLFGTSGTKGAARAMDIELRIII
jgi:hypothetical protein